MRAATARRRTIHRAERRHLVRFRFSHCGKIKPPRASRSRRQPRIIRGDFYLRDGLLAAILPRTVRYRQQDRTGADVRRDRRLPPALLHGQQAGKYSIVPILRAAFRSGRVSDCI
jgi:hypothetical protein